MKQFCLCSGQYLWYSFRFNFSYNEQQMSVCVRFLVLFNFPPQDEKDNNLRFLLNASFASSCKLHWIETGHYQLKTKFLP